MWLSIASTKGKELIHFILHKQWFSGRNKKDRQKALLHITFRWQASVRDWEPKSISQG
jgi:hypothetical protein